MKKSLIIITICLTLVLAGCSSAPKTPAPVPTTDTTSNSAGKDTTSTASQETSAPTETAAPTETSEKKNGDGPIQLSFKNAASIEYLRSIDGSTVTINGYLAESSPADGSFIFLMNLPYQSCPFCVPNTSQLANTLEVYPEKGETFGYTTQAVNVTGTLVCAKNDVAFTDDYGYEFLYKLEDAEYKILSEEDLSAEMSLWQKIAEAGIVSDMYNLYNYVDLTIEWNNYYLDSYVDEEGNEQPGYFYYSSDAQQAIDAWYSNYKDGTAFDELVTKLKAYKDPSTDTLAANVEKARALAQKGMDKLESGDYTYELQFVEQFGVEDYIYTINGQDDLFTEFDNIYGEFADWIASWEL